MRQVLVVEMAVPGYSNTAFTVIKVENQAEREAPTPGALISTNDILAMVFKGSEVRIVPNV